MKMLQRMMLSSYDNMNVTRKSVTPDAPLDPEKIEFLRSRIHDFECRLDAIDREKRKSEMEKQLLLEQVNDLETRALEMQRLELLKRITEADEPTEKDIETLDQLKGILKRQDDCSRELKELERRNRVMERVINDADKILAHTSWFQSSQADQTGKLTSAESEETPSIPSSPLPPSPPPSPPTSSPSPSSLPPLPPLPTSHPPLPPLPSSQPPPLHSRKIRFNAVGKIFYFDNRDAPSKVPRWNDTKHVQDIPINMNANSDGSNTSLNLDDEELLEEKREELKKKKLEEKYVKITVPLDEDEEDVHDHGNVNETLPSEIESPTTNDETDSLEHVKNKSEKQPKIKH